MIKEVILCPLIIVFD